ncbi:two-component system sensor histidine kinase DesK [Nocardia tenerifensis]|uniref:Two-component system sensor histidine kinase DesK n=1 Tax=Nocardia tenerifensis TaxID=228006 RepID=A0A318JWE5_9NOCA|nr:sensor histidine kinase [Nocardia tenerifensis]PXX60919.1 two-component system sensor histidine kinase DesK [Nocardia tenerifensis]
MSERIARRGPGGVSRPLSGPWLATVRHARLLLIGTTCATGALAPSRAPAQGFDRWDVAVLLWVTAAAVVLVHLRHVFGTLSNGRPRWWPATFALLTALVYVPAIWFPQAWGISQVFFIGSAAVLFCGPLRVILVTVPVIGTAAGILVDGVGTDRRLLVANVIETVVVFTVLAACLVGVAVLVRAVDQLDRTRSDLAEQAAGRERLRVSRDLHDLLGQSLSAVSLKGDLAAALLASDPRAARSEIEGVATLARDTLQAMRRVTLGEHTVSLRGEAEGATALLCAAGIDTHHHIDLPRLAPDIDDALAWGTREGVTNVLRHSAARTCSIVAGRDDGRVFLEIVNDGAQRRRGAGNGLSGLAERAAALSGTLSAQQHRDGTFRLRIEIPETAG